MIVPGQPHKTQEEPMSPQPIRFLWSARALHFTGTALLLCATMADPNAAFAADKKPPKDSGK